jgi:nitrogen regulatory protein PII 1
MDNVMPMKNVRAIIRPEKLDQLTEALAAKGFHATASTEGIRASPGRVPPPRFLGRRPGGDRSAGATIDMTVWDGEVSEAIATIQAPAGTGNCGDGKILVSPGAMDAPGRIAVWII